MPKKTKSIILGAAAIFVVLAIVSSVQNPQIISATVTPEVMVRGQDQEVVVKIIAKPSFFANPILRAVFVGRGHQNNYLNNTFKGNSKFLGFLKKHGKDSQGNTIYQGKFSVNFEKAETVQIQAKTILGSALETEEKYVYYEKLKKGIPSMRIAVTTRPFTIPNDPGEEGRKTLEGIDSDKDGLRDDLQREIFFAFPESEKMRSAMKQMAVANTDQFANLNDFTRLAADRTISLNSVSCAFALMDIFSSGQFNHELAIKHDLVSRLIESEEINTPERAATLQKVNKLTASLIDHPPEGFPIDQACDFDWKSLLD